MRKILIVEDEDILRESYEIILSTQPYVIHVAANGKEALALCEEHVYDLILLDLMMPVVNGVEFLQQFPVKTSPTKIIIMSNLSSGEELTAALKLGAHKNIIKADLSPRQLLTTVRYEVRLNAE